MSRDITSKKNELFESIDSFMDKIGPIAILVPALNLKPLKWVLIRSIVNSRVE